MSELNGDILKSNYKPDIRFTEIGMLTGKREGICNYSELPNMPVIQAWLDDSDLQMLKIGSGNIGIVYEYSKIRKESEK